MDGARQRGGGRKLAKGSGGSRRHRRWGRERAEVGRRRRNLGFLGGWGGSGGDIEDRVRGEREAEVDGEAALAVLC